MTTERDLIAATDTPVTSESLRHDLSALGVKTDDIVIVHSSLSALGWVAGGAQAVVEALFSVVGPRGTIVMPTQSGQLSDPARWSNPPVPASWVDSIRDGLPQFDPRLTPTRSMGQIVDCFRQHEQALRSAHPLMSFAAHGPAAMSIVGDHPLTPAFGDGSPLAKLYDLDAKVLLLGVGHAYNTSLHLAEQRVEWPTKTTRREGVPAMVDGQRRWVEYEDLDYDESDFETIGDRFAETGEESNGPVGEGQGRLCRQRSVVDFAIDWIKENR